MSSRKKYVTISIPFKVESRLIERLDPQDVIVYLECHNWVVKRNGVTKKAMEFRNPGFRGCTLLVPTDRTSGDFVLRMTEVIADIAKFEQRYPMSVINNISTE